MYFFEDPLSFNFVHCIVLQICLAKYRFHLFSITQKLVQ